MDCIENISLSESCLNEGWTDRPRGRVHISNKSSPVFPECCFFTSFVLPYRTILCCSVVRSKRAFFNSAHSFKHVTLLKGMVYVNNTAYIVCRNIDFSKRGTAPLKGGLDIWKCTLHSFKGHSATFQGILHILFGYCSCKNTRHFPKGRLYTLIQKGMFVLNTAFVGWYGDVVIILSHLAYSAEIVFWASGHEEEEEEEEVHEAEEVRIWTSER